MVVEGGRGGVAGGFGQWGGGGGSLSGWPEKEGKSQFTKGV